MTHIIVLLQSKDYKTRRYWDFESVNEAMEGIISLFEQHLKDQVDGNADSISYDLSQLFDYIDGVNDLVCLIYQRSSETYIPRAKDWIKEKLYTFFRSQDSSKAPGTGSGSNASCHTQKV